MVGSHCFAAYHSGESHECCNVSDSVVTYQFAQVDLDQQEGQVEHGAKDNHNDDDDAKRPCDDESQIREKEAKF